MNALVIKFGKRLYRLLKIYSALALLGALAVILLEVIIAQPLVVYGAFIVVASILAALLIWAQSRPERRAQSVQDQLEPESERPPNVPESLLTVSLPLEIREPVISDLRAEFRYLKRKYGRYSAAVWYTIESTSLIVRGTALRFGLNLGKDLTSFQKKDHPKLS